MTTLSVILFTHNEEKRLAQRLQAVASMASFLMVVDAFSTDRTIAIARAAGAEVVQHPFVHPASQLQWACDAKPSTDWVMALDINECLQPALASKIAEILPNLDLNIEGVRLPVRRVFMGRIIRYGGSGPNRQLRMWRTNAAPIKSSSSNRVQKIDFSSGFVEQVVDDLTSYIEQQNAVSSQTVDNQDRNGPQPSVFVAPLAGFLRRYIVQFGFVDGQEGLIYHFLRSAGFQILVATKSMERAMDLLGDTGAPENPV